MELKKSEHIDMHYIKLNDIKLIRMNNKCHLIGYSIFINEERVLVEKTTDGKSKILIDIFVHGKNLAIYDSQITGNSSKVIELS